MTLFNKGYHPAGTAPGTLVKARPVDARQINIRLVDYNKQELTVVESISAEECEPFLHRDSVTWVHVEGQPTGEVLRQLGKSFGLHSLALEDVLNSGQRPKVQLFSDHMFIVVSLPLMRDNIVHVHQVSLFFGKNFVISFCDSDFTPFEPIVDRLGVAENRLRGHGADYLMYSLLDYVVDHAFPVLETIGQQLEDLEEQILGDADKETLGQIHMTRRELIVLRRSLWPQRDVINQLLRNEGPLIHKTTRVYLSDCYDHTIQIIDLIETYREMSASLLEIYLSSVSNRMNDVMRVLTVIATIFIPLTFIVGVYGMNFDRAAGPWSMPELAQPLGYVFVWIVMIVVAIGMIIFFRSRKWF